MPSKVIEVTSLSKKFSDKYAVRNLSFEVHEGEIYCLVGPNGAGKTTTLRTIVGLLTPTSGRVRVMGHDVHREREKAMRYVTFVPDNPVLYGELTVREIVLLFASLRDIDRAVVEDRMFELLELFDLREYVNVRIKNLSRGTLQKLAIVLSFLPDPKLVVMDEPFMALDVKTQKTLREEIRKRARRGTAFIISSHVLPWVEEIADRVCVIHKGEKVVEGTPMEVKEKLGASTLEDALLNVLTGS
ncbi:MAG: ABC transporter ATP-binding protein [Crenarchaeota archaeon]|nr:ABC transporter ATP-binding protein [Thermoproteota archaeon]